ncbi:MAG: hypothetical protein ABID54_06835 [Pseudomonadota bacterium]
MGSNRTEDTPLLIVQVEPPHRADGGDYYYRTHAPGIAMARDEWIYVVNLTNAHPRKDEIMWEADILILNNICDPDILPLITARRTAGRLTVYEIGDDFNAIEPWNPVYFFFRNEENRDLVCHLAGRCHALQVPGSELERLYHHLNDACAVFPNQMLHVPPERSFKGEAGIVVGWGGSHGHLKDVADIAEPLANWVMSQPNAVLHLMCSEPIWSLFSRLPAAKKRRMLPGSVEDYYQFLSTIDIGLAPLKDTAYNRSRSDVKFLEYAISGVIPVVADQEPYRTTVTKNETGFVFKAPHELIDILNLLVKDHSLGARITRKARQYVLRERLQLQHGRDRVDFYREHLKRNSGENARDGQGCERFKEWQELEGAIKNGRHLRLTATRFENLLHDGLVMLEIEGKTKDARKLFEAAEALEPGNYLPHLFGSSTTPDTIDSLSKALKLNPNSIKAWVLLGEEFARRGRVQEALHSFESAVKVDPEYEVPYLRVAALLRELGDGAKSEDLLGKVKIMKNRRTISMTAPVQG